MATAKEVITDALEDILEQSVEEPVQKAQGKAGIRYLNDMMAMWDLEGISIGYTKIGNLGDHLTVSDGSIAAIKANLSIFLASKYDASVSPELAKRANDSYIAILNSVVTPIGMEFPDTLPRGSGNTYPGIDDEKYYTERKSQIVTETGGSIALEEDTEVSE